MSQPRHVAVIGGGVIGLACAHFLRQVGLDVTVIDKGKIGKACSFRNCGFICPSHVLPLAEPGSIWPVFRSLFQPSSPFRVRPSLRMSMWRWLWQFARRCNRRDMLQSAAAIQPLLISSLKLYEELMTDGADVCEWQTKGLLFAYQSATALEQYGPANQLLTEQFNEPAQRLSGRELHDFEPGLKGDLAGAWYFEHDAHLRPERLIVWWRRELENNGVVFRENLALHGFSMKHGTVVAAECESETIEADDFVIATGAWTPLLADILGYRVPIEPGKGYSITLETAVDDPQIPVIFPEYRVAVTPMKSGLRLGSIMEFAGYDETIRNERLRLLKNGVGRFLNVDRPMEEESTWFGWRPMTTDSVPVIGRSPRHDNLFLAAGHNMLGLSMAPATGKLVAEMVTGVDVHIPVEPYGINRMLG